MKNRAAFLITAFLSVSQGFALPGEPKTATFDVRHELKVTIPRGAKRVRIWFAIPQNRPEQEVANFKVESRVPFRIERDKTEGSKFLYAEAAASEAASSDLAIVVTFRLTRQEVQTPTKAAAAKPLSESDKRKYARYLEANHYVIIDDRIRKLAAEIVGDEKNPLLAARKIYDYVLGYTDYWVVDPATKKASPVGSTDYCLTSKTGNCTDIHSLWTSIARAAGIPARIVYGSFLKKELDGKDIDQSYHCWTEFYVSNIGWIPQDVALADIFKDDVQLNEQNRTLVQRTTPAGYFGKDTKLVDYYFGNLDERRVVWSVGRDLMLSPSQDGGPVNAIPKAYVEIDGQPAKEGANGDWVRKLTFTEVKSTRAG